MNPAGKGRTSWGRHWASAAESCFQVASVLVPVFTYLAFLFSLPRCSLS